MNFALCQSGLSPLGNNKANFLDMQGWDQVLVSSDCTKYRKYHIMKFAEVSSHMSCYANILKLQQRI